MKMLLFLLFILCSFGNGMLLSMSSSSKKVLVIGGTRFSGLYLWKELYSRGHSVTLFNRGKSSFKKLPQESEEQFDARVKAVRVIKGDRYVINMIFLA